MLTLIKEKKLEWIQSINYNFILLIKTYEYDPSSLSLGLKHLSSSRPKTWLKFCREDSSLGRFSERREEEKTYIGLYIYME